MVYVRWTYLKETKMKDFDFETMFRGTWILIGIVTAIQALVLGALVYYIILALIKYVG